MYIFKLCIFTEYHIRPVICRQEKDRKSLSLCNCPRACIVQWLWSLVSSQAILFYICLHCWACFIVSSSAHWSFISFYVSGSQMKSAQLAAEFRLLLSQIKIISVSNLERWWEFVGLARWSFLITVDFWSSTFPCSLAYSCELAMWVSNSPLVVALHRE